MFNIRVEQFEILQAEAMRAFEVEMVQHAAGFSPALYAVIGESQMRLAVNLIISKAHDYNFSLRGPIRLFVELMLMCGSSFDTDPQFGKICEALHFRGDEMWRAERMQEAHNEYIETVAGPDNVNVNAALYALRDLARNFQEVPEEQLESTLMAEISRGFPQRAAYLGDAILLEIIRHGRSEARTFGLDSPRGQVLIVGLMSAFGHGCAADPLYPWISRTLSDPEIADGRARAERLERKAITWLNHVLDRISKGERI